tara:strand:+ start:751 stop:1923 length:1173 start_codon:yes stop_codon:yes gene_type:complete
MVNMDLSSLLILLILILVLISILITIYNNIKFTKINLNTSNNAINDDNNDLYYRCNIYNSNKPTIIGLNKSKLEHTNNVKSNWKLYLPCGYNYVEEELAAIKASDVKNKIIFAIDGCDNIAGKNNLWNLLVKYHGRKEASTIMPVTYIIDDETDMNLFKREYKLENTYVLKKNIQRKKGITILSNYNEIMKISKKENYKVIQNYIKNLYLIEKRKINIRLYIVFTCKPNSDGSVTKEGYLYYKGKCIYTNKDYNDNFTADESHLTSVNLDNDIYLKCPETLQELKEYLGDYHYNKLWITIINQFSKLFSAVKNNICNLENLKKAHRFQIFGADVILDSNLHPYILELNKGPEMKYKSPQDEKLKSKIYTDLFCLVNIDKECSSNNKWIKL